MAFCKFSNEYLIDTFTLVDNVFINDYLPRADENAIKVYLYGLYQSKILVGNDNSLERFALLLGIDVNEVKKAYDYWRDLGLVRIISTAPFSVEYLPTSTFSYKPKKYKPEKYTSFLSAIQNLFPERPFTPNELIKYVEVIEDYKLSEEAMLMVASYCVNLKGNNIHSNYVLTVAKSWAMEGATTLEKVEAKLKEHESNSENIRKVFFALGIKTPADFDDKQTYIKWNTSWGYSEECILYVAEMCKKRGGIKKLDSILDNFYRLGIFTLEDIKEQAKYIKRTRDLAIAVNKIIGVYYENLDNIVEVYISDWLEKGFDDDAICMLANYCFKKSIKTLEGLNGIIQKFYQEGLISVSAINEYIDNAIMRDKFIKEIISASGSNRIVKDNDRDFYNTWSAIWGFSDDVIMYAASLACGKSHTFAYINQILVKWKESKISTLEEVKTFAPPSTTSTNTVKKLELSKDYTKEELDSIFGDIYN